MMIRDEALALKLTPDLQQRLCHVLQAEHLDVGFMLSGFRRRHKVSQRLVFVKERLPRLGRRVSKGAQERERLDTNSAAFEGRRVHPPGRARRGGGVHGVHELRRGV